MSFVLEWEVKGNDGDWFGIVDQIIGYTLLRETISRLRECEDAGFVRNISLDNMLI